jgi:WD40 repeat protein/DNA-binding SARP family transcriptional activator/class 3 adenylate cyclase
MALVIECRNDGRVWRAETRGSILGRMTRTGQSPDPPPSLGPEDEPAPASEGAVEEIRIFLVADVRGYTVFTQERGDEAAARLATRFADIVREHVEARNGSLIELRGDEALAVFRSPRQAIRAAVDLQAGLLMASKAAPDLPIPVGIGLDAGEAVPVESGFRGGALNLAARLCSEAGPGEILGSQSLVHLARAVDGVRYEDRGELHLKGLSDPVRVLAIVSEGGDVVGQMRAFLPRPARGAYGGRMRFRVLGPVEVDAGGGPIPLGGPKQRAVLAHLLLQVDQLVPADTLVDEIWGEEAPEQARNIIQTYVSHLRKALGRDRIESRAPGYRLRLDHSELDAARFEELMKDARRALPMDPDIAVSTLDDALALWRGPALADLADQPSFVAEAARLDELRLEAQELRAEGLLASGAPARAVGDLEALLARHPWRESLWGLLMLAYYRDGRQADALRSFKRAREILADELGLDPSPELLRLHDRVLQQDPGLELRGEPLRGYRLLEKVDDGATGVVFRAIQPHVERDVAVKIFHEGIAADPDFVRRFEADAQAIAVLEHPHIAPIYDYWREPGRAFIVSRYLRGGSLRAMEERAEPLERDGLLRLVEQVSLALAFAHRQGVAHGNVGSSNILFDPEGNAYLGDFLIRGGPPPEPSEDVRELARLARHLLPDETSIGELVEAAELGTDSPEADAFARAARAALEPTATDPPRRTEERNPYKGLRAFTEADALDFFGRGQLIRRLVARLTEAGPTSKFLAVVGPSGGGKSSVVRAGLVPAIRQGALGSLKDPFIAEMFPGAHPIDELEAALLRIAVRPVPRLHDRLDSGSRGLLESVDLVAPGTAEVVLVVDQFEEVFTLSTDERERELFLESLRVAAADPESRFRVIVTIRADFYDRPLIYPRFGELLADRTEVVPPLTPDELEQAIRGPVERVGVRPESGLVAEMIADVAHQPGGLPLLQYALTELFERRDEDRLTLAAYRELGGITGALSARAERIYAAIDQKGRRAAKQIFLRLVTLGEGRQDTRRRVVRAELDALDVERGEIDVVVDSFGHHRLLTFDREPSTREPTVEIAHEAMLTAWGRLRTWIDETREDLRQERGLARAAAEWRGSEQDSSFLLRGARLEQLEVWARGTDLAIGRSERAYLKSSGVQRDEELLEDERRHAREAQTERRSARRLRGLVAVLGAAALIAGTLTVVAVNQRGRAEDALRVSRARELTAASVANLDVDTERSILLAVEAVRTTRSVDGSVLPEAEDALRRAIGASRIERSIPGIGGDLDWNPQGEFVTTGDFAREDPRETGIIDIRDAGSGEIVRSFPADIGGFQDQDGNAELAFSADGSTLAVTGKDGALKVFDEASGDLLLSVPGPGPAWGPSLTADGSMAAAVWDRPDDRGSTARVVDLSTQRVLTLPAPLESNATALSPDGKQVAFASGRPPGIVWVTDIATGNMRELTKPGPFGFTSVAWSPDGRYIAAGGWDSEVPVWDARGGPGPRFLLAGHTSSAHWLDWSPDSSALVTGSDDGTAKVWEITDRGASELITLAQGGSISGVAYSGDGTHVMTGSETSAVKIWDVGPSGDAEWAHVLNKGDVTFAHDGSELVTSSVVDGTVTALDIDTRQQRPIGSVRRYGASPDVDHDLSPDGAAIAITFGEIGGDHALSVRDIATNDELFAVDGDVAGVDWSPSGEFLAVGSLGSVSIFDRSGQEVDSLLGGDVGRFGPHGLIATFGVNNQISIWDWQHEEFIAALPPRVEQVVFDPSGERVATDDLEIWDVASEEVSLRLSYSPPEVNALAFSPDGTRLAVGSGDEVRFFDARSGAEVLVLRGHRGSVAVDKIVFSPDGSMLASWADDGTRVWALDIDDLLEIAHRNVTRSLSAEECRKYRVPACSNT